MMSGDPGSLSHNVPSTKEESTVESEKPQTTLTMSINEVKEETVFGLGSKTIM